MCLTQEAPRDVRAPAATTRLGCRGRESERREREEREGLGSLPFLKGAVQGSTGLERA